MLLTWFYNEFSRQRARLIRVGEALLLGMDIIKRLVLVVNFTMFGVQIGQGERQVADMNNANRWVSPHVPTARALRKAVDFLLKNGGIGRPMFEWSKKISKSTRCGKCS